MSSKIVGIWCEYEYAGRMMGTYYVAPSDHIVLKALREMTVDRPDKPIYRKDILDALEVELTLRTIDRCLNRLIQQQAITRHGKGHRAGYSYKVVNANTRSVSSATAAKR